MGTVDWKVKATRIAGYVEPLRDRVVVVSDSVDETPSGLVLSELTKSKMSTGRVVSVGPDVTMVEPGDRVMYGPYDGTTCTVDLKMDDEFVVLGQLQLIAKLRTP